MQVTAPVSTPPGIAAGPQSIPDRCPDCGDKNRTWLRDDATILVRAMLRLPRLPRPHRRGTGVCQAETTYPADRCDCVHPFHAS